MFIELLYCSVSVAPTLSNEDLHKILASARSRNLAEDITGMMIYHRGEFVQILEGKKESVAKVYEKFICPDPRHTAINKVLENTISCRSFNEWSMGFLGTPEIESLMPSSATEILTDMLADDAKLKPLSPGLSAFISIYNQMRKSPYR